jgi:hypothetical protein
VSRFVPDQSQRRRFRDGHVVRDLRPEVAPNADRHERRAHFLASFRLEPVERSGPAQDLLERDDHRFREETVIREEIDVGADRRASRFGRHVGIHVDGALECLFGPAPLLVPCRHVFPVGPGIRLHDASFGRQ